MPSTNMSVLSVIYHPVYSGPHNRTAIVARRLASQGISTTVILPADGVRAADRMKAEGVDVVTMPLHRTRGRLNPRHHLKWARQFASDVRAISDVIRDRKIDVVANNTLTNMQGAFAARRAGVACVWEIIDTFPPAVARRILTPVVLRFADVVMTTGVEVARLHPGVEKLGDRWITFYPCVETDEFALDASRRERARERLNIPSDAFVVGNVGAMSPMKGHRTFIHAAALLRRTHPEVKFVILGSRHAEREAYYASLWMQAQNLGLELGTDLIVQDPAGDVATLAQAFDLFWMTSEPRSEGIPTAIGEAKSLGLPVITTDVGSSRECVTDGVSGFVVPPRDPSAIASAARRLIDDASLRAKFAAQSRREALETYAADLGARQHRQAFERALSHFRTQSS